MSKEKAPAFQFYPRDWLSDPNVNLLSFEQEGWYIRLICHCWLERTVPWDPAEAIRLLGLRVKDLPNAGTEFSWPENFNRRFDDMEELLKLCFVQLEDEPERCLNPRVEHERKMQEERRKERSASGKKGGKSSALKRMQNPSSAWKKLQANTQANSSSSSSSSSASSIPLSPPSGDSLFPEPGSAPEKATAPSGNHKSNGSDPIRKFKDFLMQEYERVRGCRLVPDSSDFVQLSSMLKKTNGAAGFTDEALRASWTRMLESEDPFVLKQGHPIRYWASNINAFMLPTEEEKTRARIEERRKAGWL